MFSKAVSVCLIAVLSQVLFEVRARPADQTESSTQVSADANVKVDSNPEEILAERAWTEGAQPVYYLEEDQRPSQSQNQIFQQQGHQLDQLQSHQLSHLKELQLQDHQLNQLQDRQFQGHQLNQLQDAQFQGYQQNPLQDRQLGQLHGHQVNQVQDRQLGQFQGHQPHQQARLPSQHHNDFQLNQLQGHFGEHQSLVDQHQDHPQQPASHQITAVRHEQNEKGQEGEGEKPRFFILIEGNNEQNDAAGDSHAINENSQSSSNNHGNQGNSQNAQSGQNGDDSGKDEYAYPKYKFQYGVDDPKTGDKKYHYEERDGDKVVGKYALVQPDGHVRIVDYKADEHEGFNAIVSTSDERKYDF